MISATDPKPGGQPHGGGSDLTPEQAKAALLHWAVSADQRRNQRWLWGTILAGGAVAIVGCTAKACIPTSRLPKGRVPQPRLPAESKRGMLGHLPLLMQVSRIAGPMLIEYLRRRSLSGRSENTCQ